MKGAMQKKLLNHVISIDRIRSNGEGTQASSSNIFGKPLALHITVTENCGISLKEKLVLRCCTFFGFPPRANAPSSFAILQQH